MYKLYGIPNCDTVKKSKKKLEELGLSYEFINFKKDAPNEKLLKQWKSSFGDWPVNKKGRTFKLLQQQWDELSESEIPDFMASNTSLIKRPVLEKSGKAVCFGFDENFYSSLT